jgi:hypothetical protein
MPSENEIVDFLDDIKSACDGMIRYIEDVVPTGWARDRAIDAIKLVFPLVEYGVNRG